MNSIRTLAFLFAVAALLTSLVGCGTQPPPVELTPTLEPPSTELPKGSPAERALAAVEALNDPAGFSYELQATALTRVKVTAGEETLNEGSFLETGVDKGSWSRREELNIGIQRKVSYPGSSAYPLNGEMRLVNGQVYLRAAFDQPIAELPAMPDAWVRVYGESTLLYWPNVQELAMSFSLKDFQQGPWSLLSGYPSEVLDEVLAEHLDTTQQEDITLPDGSPGELLTFTIGSSALKQTIRYLGENNPADERALASAKGSPITMYFTLDGANQLVEWKMAILFEVQDVDLTGTPRTPDGAQLEGKFEQNVSARIWRDPAPEIVTAPDTSELVKLPAYSGVDRNPIFASLEDFDMRLNQAIEGGEDTLEGFWQALANAETMPLIFDDLAVFLYRNDAQVVDWIADWSYHRPHWTDRLTGSDVWMHTVRLPEDARLEYQIQEGAGEPIIDPLNAAVEAGGLGSKSVMQMPGYTPPDFVLPETDVAQGNLTADTSYSSKRLGYDVNYRVYLPAQYASLRRLPVLYVTDGQDFLEFGKLAVALDNLIVEGQIQPVIAVFIDPRDVETGKNQRDDQFFDNPQYGQFIAEELVPEIDRLYRTDPSSDSRLIIGTSNGGYHSIYFALNHWNTFHLVAAFSPSIWYNPEIIETYGQEERLPLKFFISTGVFNDNDYYARQFQEMLKAQGYPVLYIESNEGHSYGNWRDKFDEMLKFFFPASSSL